MSHSNSQPENRAVQKIGAIAGDTTPSTESSQTISLQDDTSEPFSDEVGGALRRQINDSTPLILSLYAFSAADIESALEDIKNLNHEVVIGGSNRANIDGLDYVQVGLT